MNRLFINKEWSPLKKLLFMNAASGGSLTEYTATGNPVSFNTNVAKPLKQLLIPFTPVQSGSGDPSPENVRPITGWTEATVWRSGVNLFNENDDALLQDCFNYQSTAQKRRGVRIDIPEGTYTVYANGESDTGAYININVINNDGTFAYYNNIVSNKDKYVRTVTIVSGQYIIIYDQQADSSNKETKFSGWDIQLSYGDTVVPYATYTGQSYPVTFPALGKNLLDPATLEQGGIAGTGVEYASNTRVRSGFISVVAGTKYTVSASSVLPGGMHFYDINKGNIGTNTGVTGVTAPENAAFVRCFFKKDGDADIVPSDVTDGQLEASATATAYEPYTNTVYGGTLDAVSGVLTVEWAKYEITGEENFSGSTWVTITAHTKAGSVISGYCSHYPYNPYTRGRIGVMIGERTITFDGNIGDASYWKNYCTEQYQLGRPVTVVYLIDTHTYIQLDPLTVQTLIGDNTVWTDTNGENTIKYLKKG